MDTDDDINAGFESVQSIKGISNMTFMGSGTTNTSYTVLPGNGTGGVERDPLISLTVPAIMFASGVFGNLLAIFVLARSSREHKQTVFYRLVGTLACTDLFGTCATSPVTLAVYANNLKWVGGIPLCNYESFMLIFAGYATICIIGTMAVDRFLAISYPFFYDTHVTPGRAKFIIIGIWGFSAFMGCLPIMGLGENIIQFPGTWCFFTFTSSEVKNQIFAYLYAILGLLVIGLTAISNVVVTGVLLKMRRKASQMTNKTNTKTFDSELQMMILLLGIIIIFSTCWCPFLIRVLINQTHFRQVDVKADLHALRLASLNQILDPWIYILFRRELFVRTYTCIKGIVSHHCKLCKDRNGNQLDRNNHHGDKDRKHPFIKYESDYVQINTKNDQSNTKQGDNQNRNDSDKKIYDENSKNISDTSVPFMNRSYSLEDEVQQADELCPTNQRKEHKCGLNMKHSACLFCLSNHPKHFVLSTISESQSMDKLNLLNEGTHFIDVSSNNGLNCLNTTRRQSIHLSLTDLTLRNDECVSQCL